MARALIRPDIFAAWKGTSLLIVNMRGECSSDTPLSGFYYREARFLRTCRLEIDGHAPWLCEAASIEPERLLFTYTYPEVAEYGGGGSGQSGDETPVDARGIPQRSLDVRLTYRVGLGHLEVTAAIGNRARRALEFEVAWSVDADFVDIQEAQSGHAVPRAPIRTTAVEGDLKVRLYTLEHAHEQLPYQTLIHVPRAGDWSARDSRLAARLRLEAGDTRELTLHIDAHDYEGSIESSERLERHAHAQRWLDSFTGITAPGNAIVEETLRCNVRDTASFPLLEGARDEWLTLQAGVPLYPAFFGRDAVTAGWQAGCVDRGQALDAAMTRLGRLQSRPRGRLA